MSIEGTLPIIQMGHVEKLAESLENQPVVQQQATQTEAERILREQNSQVPPAESPEKTQGRRVGGQGDGSGGKNRGDKEHPPPRKQNEQDPPAPNPWAGNILNLKV